jgi:hypothetical protein
MHDAAIVAYPRPGGVLVPEILLRAGCPAPQDPDSTEGKAQAVAATIEWLRTRLARLPDEVRQAELPDPGVMLRCWQLGARTRGALARLPSAPGRRWRLIDLLGKERVGAALLADLLAAREEQVRPAATASQTSRLEALTAVIRARLPCLESELREICDGAAQAARLYRSWDADVPFRAVRRDGATILVVPSALDGTESLMMAASHLIFRHGLAAMQDVTARVRSTTNAHVDEELARRILPLLPSFRWLDEASGWFSFAGAGGQVPALIRKLFAVARRASYDDVCLAIAKQARPFRTAPRPAIRTYLTAVLRCRMLNDWVLPGGLTPGVLTKSDRAILAVLSSAGDAARTDELREAASSARITPAALRRFLRTSPIVLVDGGKVRIIGSPASTAVAAAGRNRTKAIASAS